MLWGLEPEGRRGPERSLVQGQSPVLGRLVAQDSRVPLLAAQLEGVLMIQLLRECLLTERSLKDRLLVILIRPDWYF